MTDKLISISPVKLGNMILEIQGVTSIIENKFSERDMRQMVDDQTQKTREKEPRNIPREVEEKIHRLPDGRVGFPVAGFKKAFVEAAPYLKGMSKKLAKGAFFVLGSLVPIEYEEQVVNEATVKLSGRGNVSMVRYRPEFRNWRCKLPIRYNANQISPEQIVNLANLAGFHIGVGDWNPQHSGSYGMFEVARRAENQ